MEGDLTATQLTAGGKEQGKELHHTVSGIDGKEGR